MENAIASTGLADEVRLAAGARSSTPDVATRIAAATAARRRRPDYTAEVQALLDAARTVIAESGRARVADIVAVAGLSNDAFYRHFPSKDALVAALSEQAAERIAASLGRRMADQASPEDQVRCWLTGLLAQADETHAGGNLAVLGASANSNTSIPTGDHARMRRPLADLLVQPFDELGSPDPALDAELVTHAVTNRVAGYLWQGTRPSAAEVDYLLQFCLSTARHP
jgi:AcrR family transcriptional regulator